jgi:hypothetical protein
LVALTGHAFGRQFSVTATQLRELNLPSEQIVSGLVASYEPGYEEVGGRTVYLRFFTSGIPGEFRGVISLNEAGHISIRKPRPHK